MGFRGRDETYESVLDLGEAGLEHPTSTGGAREGISSCMKSSHDCNYGTLRACWLHFTNVTAPGDAALKAQTLNPAIGVTYAEKFYSLFFLKSAGYFC